MSKELEDAIYLLNLFEASDWKEEERQEKAIEFLKSLKPKVPTFVANWYEDTIEKGIADTILDLIDPVSHVDEKVIGWFEQIAENDQYYITDDMVVMIFTRMYLFGYEVYVL